MDAAFIWDKSFITDLPDVDEQHQELVALFNWMIPEFQHKDTGKYLDSRM